MKVNEELGGSRRPPSEVMRRRSRKARRPVVYSGAARAISGSSQKERSARRPEFTKRIEHIEASLDQADQTWEQVDDVERLWDEANRANVETDERCARPRRRAIHADMVAVIR